MKATDDGYPLIILGYMVGPKVVMMGSLKPHTDVHGMFPTDGDAYVTKGLPCKNERNRAGLKIKLIKS